MSRSSSLSKAYHGWVTIITFRDKTVTRKAVACSSLTVLTVSQRPRNLTTVLSRSTYCGTQLLVVDVL